MSSSRSARLAALCFGLLAVAALPVGGALTFVLASVKVLPAAIVSVPAAFVFGLCGISAARRARFNLERSVVRRGEKTIRFARILVWSGLYMALVGAIALGFYGLLRAAS